MKWFQLSLRDICWLTLVVALMAGWFVYARRNQELVARLQARTFLQSLENAEFATQKQELVKKANAQRANLEWKFKMAQERAKGEMAALGTSQDYASEMGVQAMAFQHAIQNAGLTKEQIEKIERVKSEEEQRLRQIQ
jgi:hypothetical protein